MPGLVIPTRDQVGVEIAVGGDTPNGDAGLPALCNNLRLELP